jgi:SNF2 family DNA or RNA helicase
MEVGGETTEEEYVHLDWFEGAKMLKKCHDRLHGHQMDGVQWMWSVVSRGNRHGGLLADDMGLGKTMQVSAFVSVMMHRYIHTSPAGHVLVVVPLSVLTHWERELLSCLGDASRIVRLDQVSWLAAFMAEYDRGVSSRVCITSYGSVVFHTEEYRRIEWQLVVVDEGHSIKNPLTKRNQSLTSVPAAHRFVLTGTPIQNHLMEFFHVMEFVSFGSLLGDRAYFAKMFDEPIRRSQERDASDAALQRGKEASERLLRIVRPFFKRREKEHTDSIHMPLKYELILWIYITPTQEKVYRRFVSSEQAELLLRDTRNSLEIISILKRICMHPRLLKNTLSEFALEGAAAEDMAGVDCRTLVSESGKLMVLEALLPALQRERHRVLIFGQSLQVLDLLERLLSLWGMSYRRMDGSTDRARRQEIVDAFNAEGSAVFACLLTMGVGSVGLTLTGADRVIILDPSWNPSLDAQAVDRAYRIGQVRDVVVYRLITCATIEDKMLGRQVYKGGIFHQTMKKTQTHGYFLHSELSQLVRLDNIRESTSVKQIETKRPAVFDSPDANKAALAAATARMLSDIVARVGFFDALFKESAIIGTIAEPTTIETIAAPPTADAVKTLEANIDKLLKRKRRRIELQQALERRRLREAYLKRMDTVSHDSAEKRFVYVEYQVERRKLRREQIDAMQKELARVQSTA